MDPQYQWNGHFWCAHVRLPHQRTEVQLRICAESDEHEPSARQIMIAERIPHYLSNIKLDLDTHALRYCREIDDAVGLADERIPINYERIGDHYRIESALVGHVDGCEGNYFFLDCECDWEGEHGMEFLLDGPRILYCDEHSGTFIMAKSDEIYRRLASQIGG